ncbi:DNA repair protein RAD50 isoform X2 [Maylandia zebra]|uniref:DNA repair protein RAD50 isoform X2 n=1 Tax=Maylandia zebra TaxID=106582 RepID=UPI00403D07FA
MSKINEMSILGVRSFGIEDKDKQVISFFTPVTVLVGPNGAGKTTIIECLKFATSGELPPGSKGSAFVHDPKDAQRTVVRAQIELSLSDIKGEEIEIQRFVSCSLIENKYSFKSEEQNIKRTKDGRRVSRSVKCGDLHQEVTSALGVSKSVLNDVIFCHQEESNWPLSEDRVLKEKFDSIFNVTKYNKARSKMHELRLKQSRRVEQCQAELFYLEKNKEKAQHLRDNVAQKQADLRASQNLILHIENQIDPLETLLSDIKMKLENVTKLENETKALDSLRKQMEEHNKELEETMEEVFQGSDEQLQHTYDNHQRTVMEKEQKLQQHQEELQTFDQEYQRLTRETNDLLVEKVRLQHEAERHTKNTEDRDSLVHSLSSCLEMEGYDQLPFTVSQLESFYHQVTHRLEQENERAELQKLEQQKQQSVDEMRDRKTYMERTVEMKRDERQKKQQELKNITEELQRLQDSCSRLQELENKLAEVEREDAVQSSSVEELKAEVEELQEEKAELDCTQRQLDEEMETLNMHTAALTQMDILKKGKAEMEEQILQIRSRHCEDLVSLLGHFPNKKELEDWVSSKSKEISSTRDRLTKLKMDLASNEQNKSHITAELLKKELQLATDEEKFLNVCSSRDLEQDLSNLQRELDEIFKTKALLAGTKVVYTQFISELSEHREPCCPVCRRSFPSESEVQEVVRVLQSKLHLVPEKLKITEQDLERTERRREEIVALRPVREAIVQFQENELPALRKRLQTVDREAERLKGDVEEQEALLAVLRSEEEKAKDCLQGISLMDSYLRNLEEVERKIDQQASKLQEVNLDNTFQQLSQDKHETQDQLDTTYSTIVRKHKQIQDQQEQIQRLKSAAIEMRDEQLQLIRDKQKQQHLEELSAEITARMEALTTEIREGNEELCPLSAALEKLQQEKQKLVEQKKQREEEEQKKIRNTEERLKEITALQRDVTKYVDEGRDKFKEDKESEYRAAMTQLQEAERNKERISTEMGNIQQDIDTQKVKERCLWDNLTLRKHVNKLKNMAAKREALQEELSYMQVSLLQRQHEEEESKLAELRSERSREQGAQKPLEEQILEYSKQLEEDQYGKAEELHRNKMIEMRTTQLLSKDLKLYEEALDQAIVKFHSMKMDEINQNIRDLWRSTYRGQDIEYIEIRSEVEERSERRRSYNYRVVMMRGDADVNMRGRCSAGQKVLASLIIRLALAEAFCLDCGILALDEPTTNLDRENIESLADALVEIIRTRSQQRHFQLLIITHDEDFVQLLVRSGCIQHFYRISKNQDQNSKITKQSTAFLSV